MDAVPTPLRLASDKHRRPITQRFNFTEARLAQLKCPAGRPVLWVYDTHTRGLAYMIRSTGSRSYYLWRTWRGRQFQELLGKADHLNVSAARELAAAMNVKINAGVDVAAERRAKRSTIAEGVTVDALWRRYQGEHLELNATPRTRVSDLSLYTTCLEPIGDRRIDSLSTAELQALHRRLGKDRGKQTADHALKLIRRMVNWARIAPNPVAGGAITWFIGKHTNERTRYLTADEMPRFLAAVDEEPNDTLRDYLKLSLAIGQRRANMQAMRWSELDLVARVWTIPGAKHKTRRDTRIPLTALAVSLLRARRELLGEDAGDYVFPSLRASARTPHLAEPRYALERICKRAKIAGLTLHDLRRSMGVWMALAGTSELIIGASLGHRDRDATRRYSHIAQLDPVRQSMDVAVDAMFNIKPAPPAKPRKRKGGRTSKRK